MPFSLVLTCMLYYIGLDPHAPLHLIHVAHSPQIISNRDHWPLPAEKRCSLPCMEDGALALQIWGNMPASRCDPRVDGCGEGHALSEYMNCHLPEAHRSEQLVIGLGVEYSSEGRVTGETR
ncbi:hypothetical protein BCR34DRAFT_340920 [Clohesyomyces aquaticus]|uniref:Uncharacterized protein n=1 Tax=Clohesyomyces aquaticus TaxID=1231657 RepID=A0A1Y1ZLN9_9PLEO|nr:hypothetical protein BCR34DRAFT_340920 [Clohesyomyces aquaticus]